MKSRRTGGLPAQLEMMRQRFEQWRRTRPARTRIPASLWDGAVKMAQTYGVCQTARALRVGYYSLKTRVESTAAAADPPDHPGPAAFVELTIPTRTASGECTVELEDAAGTKMRIRLQNLETPALVALCRSFRENQR